MDPKRSRIKPSLESRSAGEHIEYDAASFSSSLDDSCTSFSLETRSLELPEKGTKDEVEKIYLSPGLNGPEDCANPSVAQVPRRFRSFVDLWLRSRLNRLDSPEKERQKGKGETEAVGAELCDSVVYSVRTGTDTELIRKESSDFNFYKSCNAGEHIEYDAESFSSSVDVSCMSASRIRESLELRTEGDFERICRSLGLSGPGDLAIPSAAWEARRICLNRLASPEKEKQKGKGETEAVGAELCDSIVDGVRTGTETELSRKESSEFNFGESSIPPRIGDGSALKSSLCSVSNAAADGGEGNGIKGLPSVLKPPPKMRLPVIDSACSTWDIFRDLAPQDDGKLLVIDHLSSSDLDTSESCSFFTFDDSSSTTTTTATEPIMKGQLLGRLVWTEIPEGEEWYAEEICATVSKPFLPKSPNCPFLVSLSLEESKAVMAIPWSFFEHMPVLKRLNLSNTSIRSLLPVSLFKLDSLKALILRRCKLFMQLSPRVAQLHNLEELDLDETQIIGLPKGIGILSNLKILRFSLGGSMNSGKPTQHLLIHPGTIKSLSQLNELKVDVDPDNEDWNAVEEVVVEEACSLERLKSLILYLPKVQFLGKHRTGCTPSSFYSRFRFTIGQRKQRIISRVPEKVEAHFQEWDKCLKLVRGNFISSEVKRVVGYAKAFYLVQHASARSLCDFGIENMENLEFCLLAESNEIQTILDGGKSSEEVQTDMAEDEATNCEPGGGSYSAQRTAFLNLQYLHIYYLKNLESIWRNPTYDKQCLSGLKVLELHVCPKLEVIFSPALLNNLGKLEVLVVEDCPELTNVVSPTSNASFKSAPDCFLPSLKIMLLLFLPKLESISSDFHIAPKLEKIGFYDCKELKGLSRREMSSDNLKVIKGEREWWEALEWDESEWKSQPDYLHGIFSPIDEDDDVMTQMQEMYNSMEQ